MQSGASCCCADADWCTRLYSNVPPAPTRLFLPESQRKFFINLPPDFRGLLDLDLGIFSPLHPPVGNHSYVTCSLSWFKLEGWPAQLATGKLCTCLALNHLFLEGWDQHLKCHQATSQLMECLGDTPRTKFPSQSVRWAILALPCRPEERPNRRIAGLARPRLSNQRAFYKALLLSKWPPFPHFYLCVKEDLRLTESNESCWLLSTAVACQCYFP